MTGLGVAFVAAALFGRDVVGVLQALGIAGIGVHALRHPLPIDLDLRQAFSQGLEGPAATETARSATIPVTLVLASVLARFLEWLWY
jgi:2-methylcitrate dehydratase PrpD